MKMQVKFFVLLIMAATSIGSCGKDVKGTKEGSQTSSTKAKEMKQTWDLSNPVARAALCEKHGGKDPSGQGGIEWEMATCRTLCTRGLGFRCGHRTFALCNDGFKDSHSYPGSCPNGASAYSRPMQATMNFYTDGSVKLNFLNSVPPDEIGNMNFEIEVGEVVALPDGILLDGISYTGFLPKVGTFKIDYSDGPFGSVILPGTLVRN